MVMSFGEFLWGLLFFYLIFFYFIMLFRVLGDLFSDRETSAVMKVVWVLFLLFLPWISLLVYLIVRGRAMSERAFARAVDADEAQQAYIRQVAGTSSASSEPSAQIAKGHELLKAGAITQVEFDSLKARALA